MRIAYEKWSPRGETLDVVRQADAICREYAQQGFDLTLRQIYYQFVARGLVANTQKSYSRLGMIINRARMAGLLDWDYIVDRTRNLNSLSHWNDPSEIIKSAAEGYNVDLWADQPTRVEVWVEKEALAGVIEQAAEPFDVAFFSCRGYVSQSEQWRAARRLGRYIAGGQNIVILHLGDHDPSGIDMTRDIEDRLRRFIYTDHFQANQNDLDPQMSAIKTDLTDRLDGRQPLEIRRIALNRDQVDEYDPPPNPAKLTDSRVGNYLIEHGDLSWELDALEPQVLTDLIQTEITSCLQSDAYDTRRELQETGRDQLQSIADQWEDVVTLVEEEGSS